MSVIWIWAHARLRLPSIVGRAGEGTASFQGYDNLRPCGCVLPCFDGRPSGAFAGTMRGVCVIRSGMPSLSECNNKLSNRNSLVPVSSGVYVSSVR
jgi:hypothetical protein